MSHQVIPAFVVAATHSGAGKTTATAVLLRLLRHRGMRVQAFKIGPDFIDPGYHREITGQPSINLDPWMMGISGVRDAFRRWSAGADVCVVEAMGGLFDGMNGTEYGSAAHLAKILDLPVVVVIDAEGMTRTVGAVLGGLLAFDPDLRIVGCVLNRVGSDTHTKMINEALSEELSGLVVGAIERRGALHIRERHLGLVTVEENAGPARKRAEAQLAAGRTLNLDRLLHLTRADIRGASHGPEGKMTSTDGADDGRGDSGAGTRRSTVARIAVAQDAAFCFYYEENLLALEDAGFELVPFRPTTDPCLPEDTAAVYLGGGYPESFATELAANRSLIEELRAAADGGMPIYAECGGMMYLADSLTDFDGTRAEMCGILPLDVTMDRDYLAIRYVDVRTRRDSPFGTAGLQVKGQEFHQSRITRSAIEPDLYEVTSSTGETLRAGYLTKNVMASYIHLHLGTQRELPENLLRIARRVRDEWITDG